MLKITASLLGVIFKHITCQISVQALKKPSGFLSFVKCYFGRNQLLSAGYGLRLEGTGESKQTHSTLREHMVHSEDKLLLINNYVYSI